MAAAELAGDPLRPDGLIGDLGVAAERASAWRRWQVQRRQVPDRLIGDELWQLARQVELVCLKALSGEVCAAAMSHTKEFKAGLEEPVRIGCQHQQWRRVEHRQHRAVSFAAE